jgi:hypothetical protein
VGGSSDNDLARVRPREWRSECGDEDTHAHNTLSAETTHVHVFYRFHPLYSSTLQIVRRPKRGDGAVSVIDQSGRRLKIPVWMLSPQAAGAVISEQIHLSKEALLSLAALLSLRAGEDSSLLTWATFSAEVCPGF